MRAAVSRALCAAMAAAGALAACNNDARPVQIDSSADVDSVLLTRADELPVLRLTPDARIDGYEHALEQVRHVRWWNGTLFFVEERQHAIRFFNAEGDSIGRFGRTGNGPGEFRNINRMSWLADTLWASDARLGRVTFIASDRTLLRTLDFPPLKQDSNVYAGYNVQALYPDGSMLGFAGEVRPIPSASSPPVVFLHIAADGRVLRKVVGYSFASISVEFRDASGGARSIGVGPPLVDIPSPVARLSLDGRRIAFMTTSHADPIVTLHLTMFDIPGNTSWRRDYPFAGDPIPNSVIRNSVEWIRDNYSARAPRGAVNELMDKVRDGSPSVHVRIRGSFYDAADRLWIRMPSAPDQHRWFIIDPDGNLVARVIVPPDVNPLTATTSHAWAVVRDEYGVSSIIRYAIERG